MITEPIRLVIWDLDETFWKGTLTEGGIEQYVQTNHDLVIKLAERGIVSSICSKNDLEVVENCLRDKGIWDYFIFPSINWDAKGSRLKHMIEQIGLRPATVLFIDDNPRNRAEAASAVPGLQVADETFADEILDHPLFAGKDDAQLTRLKQYKLIERKKRDEESYGGNSADFLRESDIRVFFDYDVESNLDRAVELVNRTNQLNYTKARLPDDPAAARAELLKQIRPFYRQAALVRVADRYGDYGYCGFFVRGNGQGGGAGKLIHFCFSCRTLGMLVERWVYDQLGRPDLHVVGEVLTDLSEGRPVDWIQFMADDPGESAANRAIPEVRLRGGCEMDSLAHYFEPVTKSIRRESSYRNSPFFIAKDCSHHFAAADDPRLNDSFLADAAACGFAREDFVSELTCASEPGSIFVFGGWSDLGAAYRHSATGRLLTVPGIGLKLVQMKPDEQEQEIRKLEFSDEDAVKFLGAAQVLGQKFEFIGRPSPQDWEENLRTMFEAIPTTSRIAAILVDEIQKDRINGVESKRDAAVQYNRSLMKIGKEFGAEFFDMTSYIESPSERDYTNHYHRIVYFRLASAIIDWAKNPLSKSAAPIIREGDAAERNVPVQPPSVASPAAPLR